MLYDGDELVAEYSAPATGSPVLLRRYVHGAGSDDPLIWYEGAGIASTALRRLRSNHQGSIVAVTNNAGTAIAINAYDEWGTPASANQGRFQYTGQAWLPELGLYYYKARIYSPTLGRFMQTDPIGYKGGLSLYDYVGGDPVNFNDPSGLYKCTGTRLCGTYQSAQSKAIDALNGKISLLGSLQSAVTSGDKLNGKQKQAAALLDKYLGGGTGSNADKIGQVIGVAQGALSDLKGQKSLIFESLGRNSGNATTSILGVTINSDNVRPTPRGQGFGPKFAAILYEEAIHSSTIGTGNYIRDKPTSGICQSCYATPSGAQRIAQSGDPWSNAANYVFALGLGVDP